MVSVSLQVWRYAVASVRRKSNTVNSSVWQERDLLKQFRFHRREAMLVVQPSETSTGIRLRFCRSGSSGSLLAVRVAAPAPWHPLNLKLALGAWHVPPLKYSRQLAKFVSKNFLQRSSLKRDGPVFF
jgi:hypothetical protein